MAQLQQQFVSVEFFFFIVSSAHIAFFQHRFDFFAMHEVFSPDVFSPPPAFIEWPSKVSYRQITDKSHKITRKPADEIGFLASNYASSRNYHAVLSILCVI